MTYSFCVSDPAPREPSRPRLKELLALLPVGNLSRHQEMMEAADRIYPLEYQPPLERQSRFRPAFA